MADAGPLSTTVIPLQAGVRHAVKPKKEHLAGIDLVRFLAAVSVAAFHLTWRNRGAPWIMPFGWVGVEVFFVISGLVIAGSACNATTRSFAVNRFLRLYPGAWCAVAISTAVLIFLPAKSYALLGIDAHFTWHALGDSFLLCSVPFLSNPYLSSAYWTLPIELAFYLIVLLMIDDGRIGQIQKLAFALILWSSIYLVPTALID